jgi:hypothetical protein
MSRPAVSRVGDEDEAGDADGAGGGSGGGGGLLLGVPGERFTFQGDAAHLVSLSWVGVPHVAGSGGEEVAELRAALAAAVVA